MNHIEKLIHELCPNGVPRCSLEDVSSGTSNISWAQQDQNQRFLYIDLSAVNMRTKRITTPATITATNAPSRAQRLLKPGDVIFATTRPSQMRWALIPDEYDGAVASTGYCVLRPNQNKVLPRFLAHSLDTDHFYRYVTHNQTEGNYPAISDKLVRAYRIPIPPLAVQRAIVDVLDKFMELEAELEARRVQYEYYRDALLTFPPSLQTVTTTSLGKIARVVRGASPRPISKYLSEAPDSLPWIKIGDVPPHSKYVTSTAEKITPEGAKKSRLVKKGDFILSNSMSFGRPYILDIDGYIHDGWLAISQFEETVLPDYLYHLLRSGPIQHQMLMKVSAGTVSNLNANTVKSLKLSIPSMSEQKRIVAILDKFDALVNDISSGLPAEIAARRKQYEYYRDRLLTFREIEGGHE
ncbi:hypothetical protein ACU19_03635 [Actinobaculum suis]|uniref:restriction endonuclease subunit S n=1 Tax=Actinobaculum suis TaxID=1657 RepID=UPI00066FED4F|nr:restriction endonuclease subunit S [Actinobaculum suis]KMY23528.1 hypothetical protein ACU19_03635 [Actinobaculum suis]